ncbi:MAG: preprotein translocase subunit SecG [Planctomycetaceae bacterium]|jgi:preprotein translocase subunit SecG|nr:preprotein translocase subunit SecG [Planctomycetaceae bacterium]
MWHILYGFILTILSVFMIFLILIQRGKGGGLAGAFGGMGGQSAFGTKAGDTFTKITVVTAIIWFVFCTIIVWNLKHGRTGGIGSSFDDNIPAATVPANSPTSTPEPVTNTPVSTPTPPVTPEKTPE